MIKLTDKAKQALSKILAEEAAEDSLIRLSISGVG